MSRTLICICLFLFAAILPAADADVCPPSCNFQLNICTSNNSFLSKHFSVSELELYDYPPHINQDEKCYAPKNPYLLNGFEASAYYPLPKNISVHVNLKYIPYDDFTLMNHSYSRSSFSIQTNCETGRGVVFAKAQKFLQNNTTSKEISVFPGGSIKPQPFDIYSVGFKTAVGFLTFTPQIAYASEAPVYTGFQHEPSETTQLMLGMSADTNFIGFETELAYQNVNFPDLIQPGSTGITDAQLVGIYGDVWANLSANKIGVQLAYGSWNDNTRQGYDFFSSYGSSLLTRENVPMILGTIDLNPWGAGLSGLMFGRIYGELSLGSRLSLMPSLTYLTDHVEGVNAFGYEIDLAAAYNLTDILTYSAAVAFAKTETFSDLADLDISKDYKIVQKLQLKF